MCPPQPPSSCSKSLVAGVSLDRCTEEWVYIAGNNAEVEVQLNEPSARREDRQRRQGRSAPLSKQTGVARWRRTEGRSWLDSPHSLDLNFRLRMDSSSRLPSRAMPMPTS